MNKTVISVEGLSKQYRLGMVGAGTLREDLVGFWHRMRGSSDPYLNIGDVNDRTSTATSNHVWALKDVNFEVKQGEVLGIIGKNGAGKSTLLKLLSRVTAPTSGRIKAAGRIASLLEVGTGFHPELSGRENIYLNGAIMGMRRAEISKKLDEIVDFAGVQRYIDTPVKRYSSGMYVRLAFAVAAHLEPEILIVDEVLAVGDAEFQQKAIGKMQDVAEGQGRTVLFVSHNMKAVSSMCTRCLLMENGSLTYSGDTTDTIEKYLSAEIAKEDRMEFDGSGQAHHGISMLSAKINADSPIKTTNIIPVEVKIRFDQTIKAFHLNLQLKTRDGIHLLQSSSDVVSVGSGEVRFFHYLIPANFLNENQYILNFSYVINKSVTVHSERNVLRFSVVEDVTSNEINWYGKTPGLLVQKLDQHNESVIFD